MLQYFLFIASILVSCSATRAQQLDPWVLAGAGDWQSNSNYSISWTLGETVTSSQFQPGATLLNGFQQPNYFYDVWAYEKDRNLEIGIFPNPTADWITVAVTGTEAPLTAELFDLYGRLLLKQVINPPRTGMQLGTLPSATYLLRISDPTRSHLGIWRVQKIW